MRKKIKTKIREKYPKSHRALAKFKRILSKDTLLFGLTKILPHEYEIQKMRSSYAYTKDTSTYTHFINDYLAYNYDNYGVTLDPVRVVSLIECALLSNSLRGEVAECGVYQGASAKILHFFVANEKKIHLFDTFAGFTSQDLDIEKKHGSMKSHGQPHINTSLEKVKLRLLSGVGGKTSPNAAARLVYHVGAVSDTLKTVEDDQFSLVHLDMDLYEPTRQALEFFIPRLCKNGLLILHDYAVDKEGYIGVLKSLQSMNEIKLMLGPLPFGDQASALFVKL